jgi:hypothetical protein
LQLAGAFGLLLNRLALLRSATESSGPDIAQKNMAEHQIVNPDGEYVGGFDVSSVPSASREYRVVAVVGCQSGGKSTLVNDAFGTHFPVLDAPKSGRRRTTLGIWAAASAGPRTNSQNGARGSPVVVLDVEGSDSRERGDGAKSFESRTTLFSLAIADVVVVNMWAHDIGRYSAANYELFETVFAHASTLHRQAAVFKSSRRVHIIMAIRDHDGESALSDIRRVLLGDLENIWDSLMISDLSFQALFNFDVVLFPHKIYAPEAFEATVRSFSSQFAERVKTSQHVPIAGFESFARTLWSAVCDATGGDGSKTAFSLDLPKHAALATYFKCGEIAMKVQEGFARDRIDGLRADIESEWQRPLVDFGTRVDAITRDALSKYDADAACFCAVDKKAVSSRRTELTASLALHLLSVRDRYFVSCKDFCMNGFEDEFRPMLGGTSNFDRESKQLVRRYVSQYRTLVDAARFPSVLGPHIEGKATANRGHGGRYLAAPSGEEYLGEVDTACETESQCILEQRSGSGVEPQGDVDVHPHEVMFCDDSDEDDLDQYDVEHFQEHLFSLVEDRKRLGELLLPGGSRGANLVGPAGAKPTPWWKGLLIRGAILLINYLQATQAHRMALKLHRKTEQDFPPGPTF